MKKKKQMLPSQPSYLSYASTTCVITVVLVTGDTDIAPAVRTVQHLCSEKKICVLFPYLPKNKELAALAYQHFKVS
jgi:uncharacterized LabA/DUF88 family protein